LGERRSTRSETPFNGRGVESLVPCLRVVLVDPLYEGNVGHIARSMMNFDAESLAIVKGPVLGDEGRDRAVHAQGMLDDALRTDSLEAALEGTDLAVGFTARLSGREAKYHRNPLDLRDWAPTAAAHPGRLALVFGREDRGLTNDEAGLCDVLVSIPTSDAYRSMNLAHAVAVVLYSLYAAPERPRVKAYTPADKAQLERLVARFRVLMQSSDFPEHKRVMVETMFRRIMGRAAPTSWEVHTLLGVFRDVLWHLGVRQGKKQGELPPAEREDDGPPMESYLLAKKPESSDPDER
jgi:tRNA/rRNA methyltransferase